MNGDREYWNGLAILAGAAAAALASMQTGNKEPVTMTYAKLTDSNTIAYLPNHCSDRRNNGCRTFGYFPSFR